MTLIFERRLFIAGTAITVFSGLCGCGDAHAQAIGGGCWLPKGDGDPILKRSSDPMVYSEGSELMDTGSGNELLDKALARGLATIGQTFGVLPAFAYYNEGATGVNAQATPDVRNGYADGTVLFGRNMLNLLLNRAHADAAILAVCSHEYGHILSFKNGMINQLRQGGVFQAEQFADYMAGYFSGTRRLLNPAYPAVIFASTQNAFGGKDHGTGSQRAEAVQEGYLAAHTHKLAITDAAQAGFVFSRARSL